ncbi:hypothetical protein PQX77_006642 [Marasmius sp. AFHP31]|nr:hypothetical protein PQX77_006642 [Marasmius sp. AFHP31]
MKRRRQGTALSNRVSFITTREDDEPLYEQRKGGSYDDIWNEARAQLRRTFDVLMRQRPRLFNSKGPGLFDEIPVHDPGAPEDDDWTDFQPAMGDEGSFNSNAGGEYSYNTFLSSLLAEAPRRADMRDRYDRTEEQTQGWNRQMPRLVDAYLKFQANGLPPDNELEDERWKILTYFDQFECHSINQLAQTLTNIHGRFPTPSLEDQLRVTYNAYLSLQCMVQSRVDRALGRDPDQYFVRHVCPPCLYQLENEAPLTPSILLAMDGNNSLEMVDTEKRAGRAHLDTRYLKHPHWLDAETVDIFKDEVADSHRLSRAKAAAPENGETSACDGPEFNQDVAWLDVNEVEGLEECADTCVERWKAAGPNANKRMYSFFAISGIFISVCRHGHVLVLCDMRRSGELMKYPLAIVKELLDRYGHDIGLGYDIMCTFIKTLLRSPQLGSRVVACRLKGVVPAFHGHAHNRKCQVSWHPMYTEGVGLEDFEECERTFSESNHLATTTCLAMEFHRQQSVLEHFEFHDVDKHMSSGNFIYHDYRQALERIANDTPLFTELCQQYGLSKDGCERLLQEETKHLTREVGESPELAVRLDYVEMLQKLSKHKNSSDEAQAKYKDAERSKRVSAEYQETVVAMRNRNYRQALDKLERLVVQRLLKLMKLNISGVGYKQREKISQALCARAKAIQKALDAYNGAARVMEPPRQVLDWKDILDMATVADFDLLRDTELDLTHVPWAQPGLRDLKRAHKEISRLNIEISRLITFMIDDHADYYHAICRAREAGDRDLAAELSYRKDVKSEINGHVAIRLVQASELDGFSGTLIPGEHEGRDPQLTDSAPLPSWASVVLGLTWNGDSFTVQGAQRDLSHILSNPPNPATPVDALLDYFEHCSVAFTLEMQQDREEEYLCLQLQGNAEQRWLQLRGIKSADMDELIQLRQVARAETYEQHSIMKRIRRTEWRIKALLLKNGSEAEKLANIKRTSEEALEGVRFAEEFSLGVIERLGKRQVAKKLGVHKRRTPIKASPAVLAVVNHKAVIMYPNESL